MDATPATLLDQLRGPARPDAWARFVRLFTPVFVRWASRLGVPPDDTPDLIQDVFVTLLRTLPTFRYDPNRSFRAWLFTVFANRWKDHCRRPVAVPLPNGGDHLPAADDPAADEAEYRAVLLDRAARLVKADFTPDTWRAFWATAVDGRPAAAVAAELGLSVNAVYLARSRVLHRLRTELAGLLE
jgi:RNA polymerase sigma-70 factor (ECF subfamily)